MQTKRALFRTTLWVIAAVFLITDMVAGITIPGNIRLYSVRAADGTETPQPTPLAFSPAAKDEILVIVAAFENLDETFATPGVLLTDALTEIESMARDEYDVPLRVEYIPEVVTDWYQASTLSDCYGATLVIWGWFYQTKLHTYYEVTPRDKREVSAWAHETELIVEDPADLIEQIQTAQDQRYMVQFVTGQLLYNDQYYKTALPFLEMALADVRPGLEHDLELDNAYFYIAYIYGQLGQYEAAVANYTHALELDPKDSVTYNNRGLMYFNLGQYEEAIADLSRVLALDPENAIAYYSRAYIYSELEQHKAAIADYTQAIELDPNYDAAYNNRGNSYADLEQYEAAIADYTRSIELDPEDGTAYYNRGLAYIDQGQNIIGIANLVYAIELDPNDVDYHEALGNVYYAYGLYDKALASYQRCLELAGDNPDESIVRRVAELSD